MIIGGAYQGKLAYAKEMFPDVRWTDGEQCEKEATFQYRGIFHFHKYIERLLSEGEDISELAKQLKEKNPEVTVVINAISLETVEEVMCAVRSGLLTDPEIVQMNVAASRVLGRYHMMTGQNPVYIITERKQ